MDSAQFVNKGETAWVGYYDEENNLTHLIITKNALREKYYLLDVTSGKRKEIASSVNPLKLEEKIEQYKEKEK